MSDRSSAWYAEAGNAERRKRRMRAYGRALTQLGRNHADERHALYQQAVGELPYPSSHASRSQNFALRTLRERYPAEFEMIFEEKLREGSAERPA